MAKVKGDIVIDIEACKGCELCISECPTNTIEMSKNVNSKGYYYASKVNEDCIACNNCALVCPDACITVYRKKIK